MNLTIRSTILASLVASATAASAATLNFQAGGEGTINGAFFTTTDIGSTGTGTIHSFVRLQTRGTEEGYNADARPVMSDVNTSPVFTRDLTLGEVPLVSIGGNSFYEFLLDVNESNNTESVSLDKLQLYTRNAALTSASTLADLTAAPSALVYDLDAGADSEILLNAALSSGSGSGDMFAYIPESAFGGASSSEYVYLYSMFGSSEPSDGGFEEWAVRTPGTPNDVPDGGTTLLLLGSALTGLGFVRRFSSKR